MLSDPDAISAVFADTPLAGRTVLEVPVLDTDETGLEVALGDLEPLAAWAVARAALPSTGRWPVLADSMVEDFFNRHGFLDRDERPRDVLARADEVAWPGDDPEHEVAPDLWPGVVAANVAATRSYCGSAPSVETIVSELPSRDLIAIDELLFRWEETARPAAAEPAPVEPALLSIGDVDRLVLLPSARPEALGAYRYFEGAGAWPHRFVAAIRSWSARFGAEPFVSTMVNVAFRVERPPRTPDEAWQLRLEQHGFTRNSDRRSARALRSQRRWELYQRP